MDIVLLCGSFAGLETQYINLLYSLGPKPLLTFFIVTLKSGQRVGDEAIKSYTIIVTYMRLELYSWT